MSLLSPNPNERVFYYSEKPLDRLYPHNECFYFKIIDYDKPKFTFKYIVIAKINSVDNGLDKTIMLKYTHPNIPKSISDAAEEFIKLTK
jgi:hypothetical protein